MRSVLIVDDMPIFREPLEALLRGEGFRTRSASNGADALNLIAESKPDAIVLDLNMPGLCGTGFLKRLRRQPGTASIPVIVLTAESDAASTARVMDLGVAGFLLKDRFSARELVARVRAVVVGRVPMQTALSASSTEFIPASRSSSRASLRDVPAVSKWNLNCSALANLVRLDVSA